MTLVPKSLAGRLLVVSSGLTLLALVFTLGVMHLVLHRFVTGQIDQRLDNKIVALMSQTRVAPDGRIVLVGEGDGPPFDRDRLGSFWEVIGPQNVLRTRWLGDRTLALPPSLSFGDMRMTHRHHGWRHGEEAAAAPPPPPPSLDAPPPPPPLWRREFGGESQTLSIDMNGPQGTPVHVRAKRWLLNGFVVITLAAAPMDAIDGPMGDALTTIGLAMAGLGAALVMAAVAQVSLGLRPLRALEAEVAAVRAGETAALPLDQPREMRPLVEEMNVLLDQNAENLKRARRHVANLAHGLKTPLATLALAVGRVPGEDGATLQALVELIDRRVRHHLGRARAAALGGPVRSQTMLGERLADLGAVLQKLYEGKAVRFSVTCPEALAVACEPQDIDEILGNLLDNAFKWTRSEVRCQARASEKSVIVEIADDGPGLGPLDRDRVLQPGERLDEGMPGFGFGLTIARELTELYGGVLSLETGETGLVVAVTLPRAITNRLPLSDHLRRA